MTGYQDILVKLNDSLSILQERQAKHGGTAPLELLNQISDHETAISLTEQVLTGELSQAEWREALTPLWVSIRGQVDQATGGVTIGDVTDGIHGSIIAGGEVKDVELFQTGDVSGSYNVIGHGASLVIQQIEALSPAEEAAKAEDVANRRLAQAIKAKVQSYQRLVQKANTERLNPYKSLNFYRLEDQPYFYGRKQAIRELLDKIHQHRLTILYADSGAGKSSLLQAGIQARLLAAGHLPVDVRLRGLEPVSQTLTKALAPELSTELTGEPLDTFLTKVNRRLGQSNLYLFLDQFEEFFLKLSPDRQNSFVTELNNCLDQSELDVRWVLSLRGEYLYRLHLFGPRARTNEYYLAPFTETEARQVIVKPARGQQTGYESGLVDNILTDLARQAEGSDGGYAPPQVQLVCHTLFEQVKSQPPPRTIATALYEAEGKAGGILTSHLGRTISQLPNRLEQDIAHELLEALVTVSLEKQRVRDARSEAELAAEVQRRLQQAGTDKVNKVLRFLVDNYLLRIEHDIDQGDRYELTHDYLLGEIELDPVTQQRKLAEQMLRQEVDSYRSSGKKTLIAADKLALIEPHIENMILDDDSQELLDASQGAVKRQKQFVFGGVGLVTVLVIVAIVSVMVMIGAQRAADDAKQREAAAAAAATAAFKDQLEAEAAIATATAELNAARLQQDQAEAAAATATVQLAAAEKELRDIAIAQRLAAKGDLLIQKGDIQSASLGGLLVNQSLQFAPMTLQGHQSFARVLEYFPPLVVEMSYDEAKTFRVNAAVALSSDGRLIAVGGSDGTTRVWNLEAHPPRLEFEVLAGNARAVAFVPWDQVDWLATGGDDGIVRVWDVRINGSEPLFELKDPQSLQHPDTTIKALAFDAKGERLASGGFLEYHIGFASVWDLGKRRKIFTETVSLVEDVALSPDGFWLAANAWGAELYNKTIVWDLILKKRIRDFGDPVAIALGPNGLLTQRDYGSATVDVYSLQRSDSKDEPATAAYLTGIPSTGIPLTFDPTGKLLVEQAGDTVRVWDFMMRRQVASIEHEGVEMVAFVSDGRHLATVSKVMVRVWDVSRGKELADKIQSTEEVLPDYEVQELIEGICQRIGRNLTLEEWKDYIGPNESYECTCPSLPPGEGVEEALVCEK
jgi:WD40 repeat protein